jgi:hypothetical protein
MTRRPLPKDPKGAIRMARHRAKTAEREAQERAAQERTIKTLELIAHHATSLKQAQEAAEWALLDYAG